MTKATSATRTIPTRGPFSLEELALFGFGHRAERDFDGVMRMAFRVDGDLETAAGVEVRQRGDELDITVRGEADPDVVARQVARVLSCDHDGEGFAALGRCKGRRPASDQPSSTPPTRPRSGPSSAPAGLARRASGCGRRSTRLTVRASSSPVRP